jgi:membrane associated rhomboid family serine protease
MFPIRDHNPSERTPYVTYALVALNLIVFAGYFSLFADEVRLVAFFDRWALIPARVSAGDGYVTVVTSMFLHGGLLHLGGNMLFLWIFGDNIEHRVGHLRFALFYLACGLLAGLAHILFNSDSMIPTVGASGAISGVLGGYLLLFPRNRVYVLTYGGVATVPALVMLGLWILMQLVSQAGELGATADTGGVAYLAHIGGFAAGLALAPLVAAGRTNRSTS